MNLKTLTAAALIAMASLNVASVSAAEITNEAKAKINQIVDASKPAFMGIGPVRIVDVQAENNGKSVVVKLNENFAYVPFTPESIEMMKSQVKVALGEEFKKSKVVFQIGEVPIEKYYVAYDKKYRRKHDKTNRFIFDLNENNHYSKGLDGNVIALWQSHGWYFEQSLNRWEWQRARLFQTVEDLYTQGYVMPFLMPMLENAGAYVMSPRERDIHNFEVIIDNDGDKAQSGYAETNGGAQWRVGDGVGFAYKREYYVDYQNPFTEGTYRVIDATKDKKKAASASWSADMPEAGSYAVYISYKSLPNSATDVVYTINSLAGEKKIRVNQTMGSSTWIYLGHFPLQKGLNKDVVTVSNLSQCKKAVVTADAVKIGGGMGNVARRIIKPGPDDKVKYKFDERIDYQYQLSKHPRFTEGSRYWLQWAGIPDSIYSLSRLLNDYNDDYRSRGDWVNYMAGGSEALPNYGGLKIPVDLAFAFHTDAGTTKNDSIIGTLGIYMTSNFDKYKNGTPRIISRGLVESIMGNIVKDVRATFEPNWTRRGMWDQSYYEARVPQVPTMLLELLSHQNFADMKYGLDPNFRFTVSRAIYKGMLEFIAKRDNKEYMVQPLPVNSFAIVPGEQGKFKLTWKATEDTLSANSDADRFIVCERIGAGAFKEVAVVNENSYEVAIGDNDVHSYKIIAMNEGGRSFPSEVLSLGIAAQSKSMVMVVNGFTRVSAPDWFQAGEGDAEIAGFNDVKDHGVPYVNDISFIGSQFEFRRNLPWFDDDSAGFGACRSDYETKVIAGNTFDYPVVHGEAILKAGYSFVSSSAKAVEDGLSLNGYFAVDLILGKQKEVPTGRGVMPNRYKTFPKPLRDAIKAYTAQGGNMFVTGSYVATDIWDQKTPNEEEKAFAKNVLGYQWRVGQATAVGEAYNISTPFKELTAGKTWKFNMTLNDKQYCVESPDGIIPADAKSVTVMRYSDNNIPAAVAADKGNYRTVIVGFPFEAMGCKNCQAAMMAQVLNFFATKK